MGSLPAAALCLFALLGCSRRGESASVPAPVPERSMQVTATAFNSVRSQTDSLPAYAAWGDTLVPGARAIAVSPELIPMGLGQGAKVRIEGLPGEYEVLDKMDARWRRRIDVYFGKDVPAAREWGRQKVVIHWFPPPPDSLGDGSLVLRDSLK
jgi:3D (Asp-Asp-Asp) domain-containing protein